jgi:hypothetical protein
LAPRLDAFFGKCTLTDHAWKAKFSCVDAYRLTKAVFGNLRPKKPWEAKKQPLCQALAGDVIGKIKNKYQ